MSYIVYCYVLSQQCCVLANIPLQVWTGPEGSRRLRLPEVLYNRHMKMARLSVLRTGRLYPQELFEVLISVMGGVHPRAIVRPDNIENLTRDFPACNAIPQPTHDRVPVLANTCFLCFLFLKMFIFFIFQLFYTAVAHKHWFV